MLLRVLQRLGILVVSLLVSSVIVFAFMAVLPGDPARVALGVNASDAAVAETAAAVRARPAATSRSTSTGCSGLLTGDLGSSYVSRAEIGPQIVDRLLVTLWLVVAAMVIAAVIAMPLGTLMAVRHRKPSGLVLSAVSQVGVAVPAFLAGHPADHAVRGEAGLAAGRTAGRRPPRTRSCSSSSWCCRRWRSGSCRARCSTRYVRSAVLDVLREDYLRTARAKGLRPVQALRRHGLRNAAVPVVTVLGAAARHAADRRRGDRAGLRHPGLGSLLLDGVSNRDLLMVQDVVMILVVAVLLVNFLVDLLYTASTRGSGRACHECPPSPDTGRPGPATSGRGRRRRLNGSLVVGGVIVLGVIGDGAGVVRLDAVRPDAGGPAGPAAVAVGGPLVRHRQVRPRRVQPDHGGVADHAVRRLRRGRRRRGDRRTARASSPGWRRAGSASR